MGDKVRGKLTQIDWSNQVSINIKKSKPNQKVTNKENAPANHISADRVLSNHESEKRKLPSSQKSALTVDSNATDIPINRYRSVVAPVTSARDDTAPRSRRISTNESKQRGTRYFNDGGGDDEHDAQVYLGYIGSVKVSPDSLSTGINAIQRPMSELYLPYRERRTYAQERILTFMSAGLQVYYLANENSEQPDNFIIKWQDILYVEPLRFSTQKTSKAVLAAFEPCEAQRLALLGNRDSLFRPLSKQHKHISLMKHPALLSMVIRSPHEPSQIFTHGYICGAVEESVFLARQVREEIEQVFHGEDSQAALPHMMLGSEHYSEHYRMNKYSDHKIKHKSKSKKKLKEEREAYTTHTGKDSEDLGTYHFGMLHSSAPTSQRSPQHSFNHKMDSSINENFVIGRPGRQQSRRESEHSISSDETDPYNAGGKPIGVVQPQLLDAFRVLPSDVQMDRSNLKPTAVNVRSNRYSHVTPELDLKLKMRQQEADEPVLNFLAPRSVVNPLAEMTPDQPKLSFLSPTPGPISKMRTSLPFRPTAALPQSGWHEPVLGNFKSKEKIDNRLNSQMVDAKELPRMESDKKEQEIANLFSDISVDDTEFQENNVSQDVGPISRLHDAMGFMP